MLFETARLTLRSLTLHAAALIVRNDRDGQQWAPDFPTEGDLRIAKGVFDGKVSLATDVAPWGPYEVIERASGLSVGGIGFKGAPSEAGDIEIGYGICISRHGQGIATEAVLGMCDIARRFGAKAVIAETDLENVASQRVLVKAGFERIVDERERLWWRRTS
jgi:RimJ/RimL family protein N-acetyltransferase